MKKGHIPDGEWCFHDLLLPPFGRFCVRHFTSVFYSLAHFPLTRYPYPYILLLLFFLLYSVHSCACLSTSSSICSLQNPPLLSLSSPSCAILFLSCMDSTYRSKPGSSLLFFYLLSMGLLDRIALDGIALDGIMFGMGIVGLDKINSNRD
ncbi:hypothetical protein K504DRAFT_8355 [Pleomassaria siparia CBS 279.74]|uniref:Uncharacterized protein n=1 Tax=Pleomassaria siparia CBS 279.74 TaxID=1314801 RepID=A0A6G1KPD1_9PLEO|nr:hypothetical protein K504DRAFT_8355 [Pleomassaria siparia CBS 279.74]